MHRRSLLAGAAALAAPATVLAQGVGQGAGQPPYPNRSIRLVVPWAAGGPTGNIGRIVGDEMAKHLGQPVVQDYRPGAGGAVGSDNVAKSPADGYALLMGGAATFYRPLVERDTPFDPARDFGFVGRIGEGPFALVTSGALPVTDLRSFIAYARARPGRLNFASAGQGATSHLAAEMFNASAGIAAVHVPYRGSAPAITDLVAGRVDYFFEPLASIMEHVRGGGLRLLGVTTADRAPDAPDVPTLAEAGLPGFAAAPWWGLLSPAGLPAPVLARLSEAMRLSLEAPGVVAALAAQGCRAAHLAPDPFAAFVRAENGKWSRVIETAGLRVG